MKRIKAFIDDECGVEVVLYSGPCGYIHLRVEQDGKELSFIPVAWSYQLVELIKEARDYLFNNFETLHSEYTITYNVNIKRKAVT